MSSKKGSAPAKKDDKAAVAAPAADAPKPPKRKAQRGGVIAVEKPPQQVGSAVVAMWQRTPIQLLNEYCQREKRPKPIFNEASCREAGKCRASVALPDTKNKTKDLFFVSDQCWDEITDARNYTCLLALQHLGDSLPLERKLPDPFREAWLSLKSAAPAVTTNRKFACADDQAKYEEQQRLASLSKEKQEESKYSKVRMSDSQREFVQDIIRSVQTSSQPTQSSAWLDDDSEQADEENTLNPTGEPAIDMLIDELNKLGFDSNDLQPAIEFADQSDWRQKEQDRQKAEQEKATTAASKPKPKLKGMPERPKSAAPVQPVLPPALLDAALEWLCVHLPEDKLPAQFDPRRKQIKLVNTKTTKDADKTKEATPKEVAPVVTVAPTAFTIAKSIDDVWSSLPLIGLPQEPCDSILSQVQSQMKAGTVTAAVKTTAVLVIFRALYAHWRNAAAPTPLNLHVKSLNEDQCRLNIETQSEEFEMLQSIYGDSDCQREEALSLWRIKLEDTAKTNNAKNCWVEFLVPDQCAYPNELPVILIKHPKLTPAQRLSCLQHLIQSDDAAPVGVAMSYQLVTALQTSLFQFASASSAISLPACLSVTPAAPAPTPVANPGSQPASNKRERPQTATALQSEPGSSSAPKPQQQARPLRDNPELNQSLCNEFNEKQNNPAYRNMQIGRARLPAAAAKQNILQMIEKHQVLVISGETGCGKSTQVPQFVLDACLQSGRGSTTSILCTQPRRISALGLAERVASERAEPCGQSVGYSVRMQHKASKDTRLLFCTTGILLRRLTFSATVPDVSHIIIDEVHERSVEIDFLLVILKRVLKSRPDLRVILMSATANADSFCRYFHNAPFMHIPGRTFPVQEFYLEDVIERSGYVPNGHNYRPGGRSRTFANDTIAQLALTGNYCDRTLKALNFIEEGVPDAELVTATLWYIIENLPPAAILVFAPGLGEISDIVGTFTSSIASHNRRANEFRMVPLHSALPTSDQQKVFDSVPAGVTKIVVATNIAETSITVDDVVYVIDTGRHKEVQYDASRRMAALVDVWCSKANCTQRKGRAGRVREGQCFRLFTRRTFDVLMSSFQLPEIHRSPLEQLCLQIKTLQTQLKFTAEEFDQEDAELDRQNRDVATTKQSSSKPTVVSNVSTAQSSKKGMEFDDSADVSDAPDDVDVDDVVPGAPPMIHTRKSTATGSGANSGMIALVLSRTLEPPPAESVRAAVEALTEIGALDGNEDMTPLGSHLARMPVDCRVGKMLIYASMFRCVTPIVRVAALMTNKSPFVSPLDKRAEADAAKSRFACHQSDHFNMLKAYEGWQEAKSRGRGAEHEFLNANFLSKTVLEQAQDACREYVQALVETGFLSKDKNDHSKRVDVPAICDENAGNVKVLKGVLCAGLFPNIIRAVHPDKRYTQIAEGAVPKVPNAKDIKYFTEDDGRVFMHPTAVNFTTQTYASPWLAYLSKIQTSKVYVRDATVISAYALLLFGGEIEVDRENGFIVIGSWIKFHADLKIAVLIRELRKELDKLMAAKIQNPAVDISASPVVTALLRLVSSDGSDMSERLGSA